MSNRYQIRFRDDAQALLTEMSDELGISWKDVILDALAVFYFAITEAKKLRELGSYDPVTKQFTAVAVTSLQKLAIKARKEMPHQEMNLRDKNY